MPDDLTTILTRHDAIAAAANEPCSGSVGTEGDCMECPSCVAQLRSRLADHNTSAAYRRCIRGIDAVVSDMTANFEQSHMRIERRLSTLARDLADAMGDEEGK